MSFQEKSTWVMLVLVGVVYGGYFAIILGDIAALEPVRDIAYKGLMVATVVVLVILATATHIVIAVASPREADKYDERDREINRFGEYLGGFVAAGAALLGMGLAMFEVPYFWIANAILAGLVVSEVVSGMTKVILYRRGI